MINIKNLCKSFKNQVLFENFELEIEEGKTTCITGPSGCGKTTLLRIIAGVEAFESGEINGVDSKKLTYLFQEDRLLPWLNTYNNISIVLRDRQISKEEKEKIINQVIELLNLENSVKMTPQELSGGMQRRVALGRALAYDMACHGKTIILDEPFKGLDTKLKYEIIQSCRKLWENKDKTVIVVTHDMEEAQTLADNIYELLGRPVTSRKIEF